MYVTFASAKIVNKAEPTLALTPRGDVTRNPKQGYQWPQKRTCVRQKLFKKKKKKKKYKSVVTVARSVQGHLVFQGYQMCVTFQQLFEEIECVQQSDSLKYSRKKTVGNYLLFIC